MSSTQAQGRKINPLPLPCHQFKEKGTCSYGAKCKFSHVEPGSIIDFVPATNPPAAKSKPRRRRNNPSKPLERTDPRFHIKAVFAYYPQFDYQSSEPVMDEFYRMCDRFGWSKTDEARQVARNRLKDALAKQFNDIYGTDVNDLSSWQKLCSVLNLPDIPKGLDPCRELVKSMYVNMIDLVDTPVTQVPVEHFESEVALSKYTKATGKIFPRDSVHAGDLLMYLLRHIIAPGPGKYYARRRVGEVSPSAKS